jgi:hypothetical protein
MNKCTIRFIRKNEGAKADDILTIYEDEDFAEMYRIVFRPGDFKKTANEFYLDRARALEYVASLLKMLPYDADPFAYVQVDTSIHPSILYNVCDLIDRDVRYIIEDAVDVAIRRPVEKIRVKTRA